MNKIISALATLFLMYNVSAQTLTTIQGTEKYIEVKVSDTMTVAPDIIKFMISIENSDVFDYETETEAEDVRNVRKTSNKQQLTKNQIEMILNKHNFPYKYNKESEKNGMGSTKGLDMFGNSFEVTLNSMRQLETLEQELEKVDDIETMIMSTSVSNKHQYELQLLDILMKKAREEAGVIAKSMNVTLDAPLNVSNTTWDDLYSGMFNNPNSMGGLGSLFSMFGNMFKSGSQKAEVVISKSIIVRFSYK
jgi:uncharacterized protein YggE